jgi:hypothetical protein
MRANVKIILMVSVPVRGETLEEGIASARQVKITKDIINFKQGVEYNDGKMIVTGVDTGEWTE